MSQWISAILVVVGFFVLVQLFRLIDRSQEVLFLALQSLEVMQSPSLDDDQKEMQLQAKAKQLFGLFFLLALGGAVALLLPLVLIWLGDRLGWVSLEAVFEVLLSPIFIIIATVLGLVFFWFQLSRRSSGSPDDRFTDIEKSMYRLAFMTYGAQVALADAEDWLFSSKLAPKRVSRPVFITGLPRAGTTLLLECLAPLPEFATHCYRDMPFVMIPCFWERFSKPFQQSMASQERAHGDGMMISSDSPEALEEVLWQVFWHKHYQSDRIIPWQMESHGEFEDFFRSHMSKIIFLRRHQRPPAVRYVSKNNLNIARIALLRRLFPDAVLLIPFRQPLEHATSLLGQHLNFLQIHQEDPFASEYMRAIGHYDFGENLCPVDFNGWFDQRQFQDTTHLAFWLEYWAASYQHLLTQANLGLSFFNYDAFCAQPQQGLIALAEVVQSENPESLIAAATQIRSPRPKTIDLESLPKSLLADVNQVYTHLQAQSLN